MQAPGADDPIMNRPGGARQQIQFKGDGRVHRALCYGISFQKSVFGVFPGSFPARLLFVACGELVQSLLLGGPADEKVAIAFVVDNGVEGRLVHHRIANGVSIDVKVVGEEEPDLPGRL